MSGPLTAKPRPALHAVSEFERSTRALHNDGRLLLGCQCQPPDTVKLCTKTAESVNSLEIDPRREPSLPSSAWVCPPQEANRADLASFGSA